MLLCVVCYRLASALYCAAVCGVAVHGNGLHMLLLCVIAVLVCVTVPCPGMSCCVVCLMVWCAFCVG